MSDPDVVALLAQHRTIGAAPREELEWVAAHGYRQHYDPDRQVWRKGEPIDALYVLLSGYVAIWVDRGIGPRKVDEWRGGDVTGLLPYSRMSAAPGDTIIGEPTDVFVVDRVHFPELTRQCPTITAALVHVMLDRARTFTSSELLW